MFKFGKKKSKKQLEKHLERGKGLLQTVTKRLSDTIDQKDRLYEQLKTAYIYISALTFENGIQVNDDRTRYEYNIQRKDLLWAMENLRVTFAESTDKETITLIAEVKPPEEDSEDDTNNDIREADPEGDNDSCTSEEGNVEPVHTEGQDGVPEASENTGDTTVSGNDSVDVQGETSDLRVYQADGKNLH